MCGRSGSRRGTFASCPNRRPSRTPCREAMLQLPFVLAGFPRPVRAARVAIATKDGVAASTPPAPPAGDHSPDECIPGPPAFSAERTACMAAPPRRAPPAIAASLSSIRRCGRAACPNPKRALINMPRSQQSLPANSKATGFKFSYSQRRENLQIHIPLLPIPRKLLICLASPEGRGIASLLPRERYVNHSPKHIGLEWGN